LTDLTIGKRCVAQLHRAAQRSVSWVTGITKGFSLFLFWTNLEVINSIKVPDVLLLAWIRETDRQKIDVRSWVQSS